MKHPHHRGERRRARQVLIDRRTRTIAWAYCERCAPAPCRCADQASRRGRLAKTPVPCSCWMCGNPRRHEGQVTLAEAKASGRQKDGLACQLDLEGEHLAS